MSFRPVLAGLSAVLVGACFLLALLGPVAVETAEAQSSNAANRNAAYRVGGVAVDAMAETATEAREAAIVEGQGKALVQLYKRLVVPSDVKRLPLLLPEQIQTLVQGFSVANEKSSTGRYLADFTVAFNPNAVRALFQQYRVRFADSVSRPLLVFPVIGSGEQALLWREPNPWRGTWAQATGRGGLVPIEVPLGDLADMGAVTAGQALSADAARLQAVADRYGQTDVLVAQAVVSGDADAGNAAVQVVSQRLRNGQASPGPSNGYQQAAGEDLRRLLARAVEGTVASIEAGWRQANALDYSQQNRLAVAVPFGDLGELAEVRRRLGRVPTILASSVTLMKRDRAELVLTVAGSIDQLSGVLAQQDLLLSRLSSQGQQGTTRIGGLTLAGATEWQVRLTGAGRAGVGSGAQPSGGIVRTLGATPQPTGNQPLEDAEAGVERLNADELDQ